ncbi:hypothetical protein ACFQL9_13180 [Halobaculum lipolyticum]|uniref:Uncharacterized protein n=1 Tax=Halobaculum lipolyticum TaxID=3032001 RepID=A0ABD5WGB8_9EURY
MDWCLIVYSRLITDLRQKALTVALVVYLGGELVKTVPRWVIFHLLDGLTAVGITALPLATYAFPAFATPLQAIEYVLILWLFAAMSARTAVTTEFFPNPIRAMGFALTVAVQWLLFVYFAAIMGSGVPYWDRLPIALQYEVSILFASLPLLVIFSASVLLGMLEGFDDEVHQRIAGIDYATGVTYVFLSAASFAILYQLSFFFEVLALSLLCLSLISNRISLEISAERSLERLLRHLDTGLRGFATGMFVLTGLYLSVWALQYLRIQLTFLYMFIQVPQMRQYSLPFIAALLLTGALILVAVGWVKLVDILLERNHSRMLWLLFGAIVVKAILIRWLQSFVGNMNFGTGLSGPVVFAVAVCCSLLLFVEAHNRGHRWLSYLIVLVAGAALLPSYFASPVATEKELFVAPILAYGSIRVLRTGGIILGLIGSTTATSSTNR